MWCKLGILGHWNKVLFCNCRNCGMGRVQFCNLPSVRNMQKMRQPVSKQEYKPTDKTISSSSLALDLTKHFTIKIVICHEQKLSRSRTKDSPSWIFINILKKQLQETQKPAGYSAQIGHPTAPSSRPRISRTPAPSGRRRRSSSNCASEEPQDGCLAHTSGRFLVDFGKISTGCNCNLMVYQSIGYWAIVGFYGFLLGGMGFR